MADIYEDVIPTIIPNTTMRLRVIDGNPRSYWIKAVEGYVLHDTNYDIVNYEPTIDNETGEEIYVETRLMGYHTEVVTCSARYDFSPTQVQDDDGNTHTAYGSRQFFTRSVYEVPTDQIFGVVDESEHEIM